MINLALIALVVLAAQQGSVKKPDPTLHTIVGVIDTIGTTTLGGKDMFTLILTPPGYKPRTRQPTFAVDPDTRWKFDPGDNVRITYKDPPPEAQAWVGTAAELRGVVVKIVKLPKAPPKK
jgi:hypothetical protein